MKNCCLLSVLCVVLLLFGAAGAGPAFAEAPQWDADVVVVGGGNAGIPTAIAAARAGANVIVLEKMPYLGGTLIVSGGQLSAADTKLQIAAGFEDSAAQHYRDIMEMGDYRANPRLLKKHTENAAWTIDWLGELGVDFDRNRPVLMDHHELYSVPRSYQPVGGGSKVGEVLIAELNNLADLGLVDIHMETTAVSLVQDDSGKVIGVKAENADDEELEFYAPHVVLATGGYGANRSMLADLHGDIGENALTYVPDHAQGDGITMSLEIGAELVNTDFMVLYPGGIEDPDRPGYPYGPRVNLSPGFAGDIWVNEDGRRWVNEDTSSADEIEIALLRQPNVTSYVVFDQTVKEANDPPIHGWSWEDFEEAAAEGLFAFEGNTVQELAENAGIDKDNLAQTIEDYNHYVEAGWDRAFDRPGIHYTIDEGPFYALQTKPLIYLTHSGLNVSADLQVMHEQGTAIPGLYAVGEVIGMGQLMGRSFAGGVGNTAPITLGLMLGEALAGK